MTGAATRVGDRFDPQPIEASTERFRGLRWTVRSDRVRLSTGQAVIRDIIVHTGAVGVVVLDDQERVLLNRQYRHPVGAYLWEPPAGLMDEPGESPLECVQRELVEEAGIVATDWSVLVDLFNSPGGSSEAFRCFLARGISAAPGGRPAGDGEEADLEPAWVPLDRAVALVMGGDLNNPTAVVGLLAASRARDSGYAGLRPADAPWPARENLLATQRVRLD